MIDYSIRGKYVYFLTREEACNEEYLRKLFPKKKFNILGGWIRTTSVGVVDAIREAVSINNPIGFGYVYFLDPSIPRRFAEAFKTPETLKIIATAKAKFMKGLPKISEKILSQEKMF